LFFLYGGKRKAVCGFLIMFHTPVLLEETLKFLDVKKGGKYIDATVGGGGHAAAVLRRGGEVLGIDMDQEAVQFAHEKLAGELQSAGRRTDVQISIVRGNFRRIDEIAKEYGFENCDGVLFDLGMSSWQIDASGRGFSFLKDEVLDMRMDPNLAVTAKDLLAGLKKHELKKLFSKYAEEQRAGTIAETIARARKVRKFKTTKELSGLLAWVEMNRPQDFWHWYETVFKKTPDKYGDYSRRARIFQALRIAVNDEINNLRIALPRALRILDTQGRLVVISFHSLEDRVVKEFGKDCKNKLRILTEKAVTAEEAEIKINPRARSAKLRAFEKI